MKKLLLIGLKDLRLAFREKAALILMLLAPFILTLGLGTVTGRFSGGSSNGISHIPVILVNQDNKQLGNALVQLFQSSELDELVDPTVYNDTAAAYKKVDQNDSVAVILIPSGFTESITSPQSKADSQSAVQISIYSNPTTPTSVGVIKTILEGFLSQVEVGRVSAEVVVTQLLESGRIQPSDVQSVGSAIGMSQVDEAHQQGAIRLNSVTPASSAVKFDVLALLAPSMALMFLIYTVSYGGRSFLIERNQGTLPRLLVTPTTSVQIMGGKMMGIFFTGTAQMFILVLGTTLLFSLQWGDASAVLVLVLSAVFAAVGWGLLLSTLARTPGQVGAIGSAMTLTFGILGGGFINMDSMPLWFRIVTKISPNAWGLEGFTTLALGGKLPDILTPILALLCMGILLFSISVFLMKKRGLVEK